MLVGLCDCLAGLRTSGGGRGGGRGCRAQCGGSGGGRGCRGTNSPALGFS